LRGTNKKEVIVHRRNPMGIQNRKELDSRLKIAGMTA
jgi:hypothetical protein